MNGVKILLSSLLSIYLFCVVHSASEFRDHGFYWSTVPNAPSSISENGVWRPLDDNAKITFTLNHSRTVVFSYAVSIEGLRGASPGHPLPSDIKDTVQIRCLVDSAPHRSSSSYATSNLVETRVTSTLSGVFAADLGPGNHVVVMQWKKIGNEIQQWNTMLHSNSGYASGFAFIASTNHKHVWYTHETKDMFLSEVGVWKDVTETLSIELSRKTMLTIESILTAHPQTSLQLLGDRKHEYITTRLVVDGQPFVEGSLTHGATTWNPTAGNIHSFITLNLTAGTHSVKQQWKKMGTLFSHWSSRPSYLDGFASSRNIIAYSDKYTPQVSFGDGKANILKGDDTWHTVANKVLSFNLIKESAVHFTYGLPLTQHGNPNFDSNLWSKLHDVQARLLVDNTPYISSSSGIHGASRKLSSAYGELALVLPAGSHTVALQWRTDAGCDWMVLNHMDDGFAQHDQLLVVISSENASPQVSVSVDAYVGDEDTLLPLSTIEISDIDTRLQAGIVFDVVVNVTVGKLSLPSIERYSHRLLEGNRVQLREHFISNTVDNINKQLSKLLYVPPHDWSGGDTITIFVSDRGDIGTGEAKTFLKQIPITINPVDDLFTVVSPSHVVVEEGSRVNIGGYILNDIDSEMSEFYVELSCFCGHLTLNGNSIGIRFSHGDGVDDTSIKMQGIYGNIREIVSNITYSARSNCNRHQQGEFISAKFVNIDNLSNNISSTVAVEIIEVNDSPEIISMDYPRWDITGIRMLPNADTASATFGMRRLLSQGMDELIASNKLSSIVSVGHESLMTDVVTLSGPHNQVYAFSVSHTHAKISLASRNVVPVNTVVTLAVSGSTLAHINNAECVVNEARYPAFLSESGDELSCEIYIAESSVQNDVAWLYVASPKTFTNAIPLYVAPMPIIKSISKNCVYEASEVMLDIVVEHAATVNVCIFSDSAYTFASVDDNIVRCLHPPSLSTGTVNLRVGSLDTLFVSNEIEYSVVPNPVIHHVGAVSESNRDLISLTGQFGEDGCANIAPRCVINGEIREPIIHDESEIICEIYSPIIPVIYVNKAISASITIALSSTHVEPLNISIGRIPAEPVIVSLTCSSDSCGTVEYIDESTVIISQSNPQGVAIELTGDAFSFPLRLNTRISDKKYSLSGYHSVVTTGVQVGSFTTPLVEYLHPLPLGSHVPVPQFSFSISSVEAVSLRTGNYMRIRGEGLDETSIWGCWFDEQDDIVPAFVATPKQLSCVIPPNIASNSTLVVVNLLSSQISNVLSFDYIDDVVDDPWVLSEAYNLTRDRYWSQYLTTITHVHHSIISISPVSGWLGGSEIIRIVGEGFHDDGEYQCVFGEITSDASFVSSEELTCVAPKSDVAGMVPLTLHSNKTKGYGYVTYRYVDEYFVNMVVPSQAPVTGGSLITVIGGNFFASNTVECIFGEVSSPARVINVTTMECLSPMHVLGDVEFSVSIDNLRATSDAVFGFIPKALIHSVTPSRGSEAGSTVVILTGEGFLLYDDAECIFGDISTTAIIMSESMIQCVTPPHAAGLVDVSVAVLDDVLATLTSKFEYVAPKLIQSATPSAGSTMGNTVVTIIGSDFDIASRAKCKFGDESADAIFLNNSAIACLAPSTGSSSTVNVSVEIDDIPTAGIVQYTYYDPIDFIGLYPSRGSSQGGTSVIITAHSFTPQMDVSCLFGTKAVRGRVIDELHMECTTPMLDAGISSVGFFVDSNIISTALEFEIFEPLQISSVDPSVLPIDGQFNMHVRGSAFTKHDTIHCSVDGIETRATILSDSEVVCVATPHPAGEAAVTLIGMDDVESNTIVVAYAESPRVLSIHPNVGVMGSSTDITLLGEGFSMLELSRLVCDFGNVTVAVRALDKSSVVCGTPATLTEGVYDVVLKQDNYQVLGSGIFYFVEQLALMELLPKAGTIRGGNTIAISGSFFLGGTELWCIFDDEATIGKVINETVAECVVPATAQPKVSSLTLKNNGVVAVPSLTYRYVSEATMVSMKPTRGGIGGATVVSIVGTGFSAFVNATCNFGEKRVPAIIVTDSELQCSTPLRKAIGIVETTITFDEEYLLYIGSFEYYVLPSVEAAAPLASMVDSITSIKIVGSGFMAVSSGEVICTFGETKSAAIIIDDAHVECDAPVEHIKKSVIFRILIDGYQIAENFTFEYIPVIVLTNSHPTHASSEGGAVMHIFGNDFKEGAYVLCMMGGTGVPGFVLNSTVVTCVSPPLAVGQWPISLRYNELSISSELSLIVKQKFHLLSVSPSIGSSSGGSMINLTVDGLFSHPDLKCRFNNIDSAATIIDSGVVSCTSPAQLAGDAHIRLYIGADLWSNDILFTYYTVPTIDSISPQCGSISGGNVVVITGSGFSAEPGAQCNFGDLISSAHFVSDTEMHCIAPPVSQAQIVSMSVTLNGLDKSLGAIYYHMLEDIHVYGVYPTHSTSSGGERIIILGEPFVPTAVECVFGDTIVRGSVLNATAIECITPEMEASVYQLSVRLCHMSSSNSLDFFFDEATTYDSFVPSKSMISGGTEVHVSGDFVGDELYCEFDHVLVHATIISKSLVSCIAPAHSAGNVSFSIRSNDSVLADYNDTFQYVVAPTVDQILPVTNFVSSIRELTLYGHDFDNLDTAALRCSMGNHSYSAIVESASTIVCVIDIAVSGVYNVVLSDGVLMVASSAHVNILNDISVLEVFVSTHPDFHTVTFTAEDVSSAISCSCRLGDIVEVAEIFGYSIECKLPNKNIELQTSLVCNDIDIISHEYTLDEVPVIDSLYFVNDDDSVIHVASSNLRGMTWFCVYSNTQRGLATYVSENTVACDAFGMSRQDTYFYLINTDWSIVSAPVHLADAVIVNIIQSDEDLPVVAEAVPIEFPRISMSSFFPTIDLDHSLGVSNSTVALEYLSQEHVNGYTLALFGLESSKPEVDSCFIDGLYSCLADDTDVENQYLDDMNSTKNEVFAADPSSWEPSILAIDRMDTVLLNPYNGSWVTVSGKTFTNETSCVLNSEQLLDTVYYSPHMLRCFVPVPRELPSIVAQISLTDRDGTLSENVVSLFYDLDDPFNSLTNTILTAFVDSTSSRDSYIAQSYMPREKHDTLCIGSACNLAPVPYVKANSSMMLKEQMIFNLCQYHNTCLSDIINVSSIKHNSVAVDVPIGRVIALDPMRIEVNSTSESIRFIGTHFPAVYSYCCKVFDEISVGTVHAEREVECPMFAYLPPGFYNVTLMRDCIDDIESFPLEVTLPQIRLEDASSFLEFTDFVPMVNSLLPQVGSYLGGTNISIVGSGLASITLCRFVIHGEEYFATASVSNDTAVSCVTPTVASHGIAKVSFVYAQDLVADTRFQFNFIHSTVIDYSIITNSSYDNPTEFTIVGYFDGATTVSCKVVTESGKESLIFGRKYSVNQCRCYSTAVWDSKVQKLYISFNMADYTDAKLQDIENASDIVIDGEMQALPKTVQVSTIQYATTPALSRSMICDGTQTIQIDVPATSVFENVACYFDGIFGGDARYVSPTSVVCLLPSHKPGMIEMSVKHKDADISLAVVNVTCEVHVTVHSLAVNASSVVDGSSTLFIRGMNLMTTLPIYCMIDNLKQRVSVNSMREGLCTFPLLKPGSHDVSIFVNRQKIFVVTACLSSELIRAGGELTQSSGECFSGYAAIKEVASKQESLNLDMTAYFPRIGTEVGGTEVEIIAQKLIPFVDYSCMFGDVAVSGQLIDEGRLRCVAPPSYPRQVTLKVISHSTTWCCGIFDYISRVKIVNVSMSGVSRPGHIVIRAWTVEPLDIDKNEVFCHIDDDIVQAQFVNNDMIVCNPYLQSAATVRVAIGSLSEMWSNTFSLELGNLLAGSMTLSPTFGTIEGGTAVTAVFLSPVTGSNVACYFNGVAAKNASVISHNSVLCISPQNFEGRVKVQVKDVDRDMLLATSDYLYERPPDVSNIIPANVMQGKAVTVFISGVNFKDSEYLSCIANGIMLPARWMTSSMLSCVVPASSTVPGQDIVVRTTNNKVDISRTAVVLRVMAKQQISSLEPTIGFSNGGTIIRIILIEEFEGSIACNFGDIKTVNAYRSTDGTFFCQMPPLKAGMISLSILHDTSVIGVENFEVVQPPTFLSVHPDLILSAHDAEITIEGLNFLPGMSGRIRTTNGTILESVCTVFTERRMNCRLAKSSDYFDNVLYFDVTITGVDYISSFASIRVAAPVEIVSISHPPLYASGGAPLTFSALQLRHIDTMKCVLESLLRIELPVRPGKGDGDLVCVLPALDIGTYSISLEQMNHIIYGPVLATVQDDPRISEINPGVIISGITSIVTLSFSQYLDHAVAMDCVFDGVRYPVSQVSPTVGTCALHPIRSGSIELSVAYPYQLNATFVTSLSVVDSVNDIEANTTNIMSFQTTFIKFSSPLCVIRSGTRCSAGGVDQTVVSIDECEVVCSINSRGDVNSTVVALSTEDSKDYPYFSYFVEVLRPVAIVGRFPVSGSALGGTVVTLYGVGFVDDASLECIFGTKRTKAFYLSLTRVRCVTPEADVAGVVDINVKMRGEIISSSIVTYEYLPILSILSVNTNSFLAIGGTSISVLLQEISNPYQYQCRFEDVYVQARPINGSALECVTPALNYDVVSFAISSSDADVSNSIPMFVRQPPSIISVEPLSLPANQPSEFVLQLSFDISMMGSLTCRLNGYEVPAMASDATIYCSFDEGLEPGPHTLTVVSSDVAFGSVDINVRSTIVVSQVTPLSGFSSFRTTITAQTVNPLGTNDHAFCCFDEEIVPAFIVTSHQYECATPRVPASELKVVEFSVAGPDKICQDTSFRFRYVPVPAILKVEPTSGPVFGGTEILISLSKEIDVDIPIFCRVGSSVFITDRVNSFTVVCITRAFRPSIADIELSVNGIDFVSTGYKFNYLLLSATSDVTEDGAESDVPEVFSVSPSRVASSRPESIRISGARFQFGCYCLLADSLPLKTTFISDREIECITVIHIPGNDVISVVNPSTPMSSKYLEITFENVVPRMKSSTSGGIFPTSGPRTGGTAITVSGYDFSTIEKSLMCLIGDEWVFASRISDSGVVCLSPPSLFSGRVNLRLATADKEFLPGLSQFNYVEDPVLFAIQPEYGTVDTLVEIKGKGFSRFPMLTCMFGSTPGVTAIVSDVSVTCVVPPLATGSYGLTVQTNGQQVVRSGIVFNNRELVVLESLFPSNGPALRGGTVVTVFGRGFPDVTDIYCVLGDEFIRVDAVVLSEEMLQCRMPSHRPGRINITIYADGTRLHSEDNYLEYVYAPDVSVDKITPEFGYTSGGYPVFVFGTNFVNTTSLGCKFANMKSRGIFLTNTSIVCLAPSPLGREALRRKTVYVEVTINGYDYSENHIEFDYSEPCDEGFFCPSLARQLCPNGTHCPVNSRNFTLCSPGTFQPREGQSNCVICPVGYICPDHGMPRPVICPAGQICDTVGLRASGKSCPMGHYCLNGTKASSASEFEFSAVNGTAKLWLKENSSGVVYFDYDKVDWSYKKWPFPAVGESRPVHPPEPHCDGLVCIPGSQAVLAEAPFPCPIGHYCRAGVAAQFPIPKNFSTPQRCFDGFFCPRGSINPEGQGPCPTGYFCPTQLNAIICPRGHYCPGVGNTGPIECYPGTYNPSEGKSNCTVCPTGHICPGWGSLLPEVCPAGFVCSSLGLPYPVVLCPAGYYCLDGTYTLDPADPTDKKPLPCNAGTFCLGGVSRTTEIEWIPTQQWGSSTPQACSEGTYCKQGAYAPSGSGQCFKGHYCPPKVDFPIQTPIGNFAGSLGSVAPTLCFPGTYAPLKAQVDCLPCPAGHSCKSYGTYIPSICGVGTFRSLVDSVTCRLCITGTFSDEVGAADISMCLPCPQGRICGLQGIYNLAQTAVCPAGQLCGFGTDRTRQFLHKAPGGYHCPPETAPINQYDRICPAGYYCTRGTSTALALRAKCSVGFYCPKGTSFSAGREVKCPRVTTSLSGMAALQSCRVFDIDVCDKAGIDIKRPMEDLTYYPFFEYKLLDTTKSTTLTFHSSATAINPTGEVVVVRKVMPINITSSSPFWVNDTIEAFRPCPQYGSAESNGAVVTIIGRNFLNTGSNFCRWRTCISAQEGLLPRRCKNRGNAADGSALPLIGEVSEKSVVTLARYISPTRMECTIPDFVFNTTLPEALHEKCKYINETGGDAGSAAYGNMSYVRACTDLFVCMDKPAIGYEYYSTLSFPCTGVSIADGSCDDNPEEGYMMNPCMSHEVLVEVSNNGFRYSGGDDLRGIRVNATARPLAEGEARIYDFVDYIVPPTVAVYTYIDPAYYYDNPDILQMEKDYCTLARYSEESPREREMGWYQLRGQEVAHIHVDLRHIPDNLVYGEHYRFALFISPSRCVEELCNENRVRLTPTERMPCKLPKDFSEWFLDESVVKNTTSNITVYALDDMIFKFEVHIMVGLYAPYVPFFKNCTTVRLAAPSRGKVSDGVTSPKTMKLSPYVSFEERLVKTHMFFAAVYMRSDSDSVSLPLNLPPRDSAYERGRALIMYNTSADSVHIPDIYDDFNTIAVGSSFWDMPAATTEETKEIHDAYFETFHGMSYGGGKYAETFDSMLVPYMLFFSNCRTFDSYMPIWLLFEGQECSLPDEEVMGTSWPRYDYPPLPDQDDIKVVGPWDFFQEPVADWCERSIKCHYEERLNTLDIVPRWFEASSGDSLFSIIREPITYQQYTGRPDARIHADDQGGGAAIADIAAISTDIFISVTVDREAANDFPGGCTLQCFPRTMLLDIGYYQLNENTKRLIYISLVYDDFDLDITNTEYNMDVAFYALSYFELLIYFAFEVQIFIILFIFVGAVTVTLAAIYWIIVRLTTSLQNPPELKVWGMLVLVTPPPTAGVVLALIPVTILTGMGYYLVSGDRLTDPAAEVGGWILDDYQLSYVDIGGRLDPADQERARGGRLGIVFLIISFFCCFAGTRIFLPKKVSKRENELALKRDRQAEKESIWAPTLWKRSNLMFASLMMGMLLVLVVEFSFWGPFGDYIWYIILMLKVFAKFIDALVDHQLKEALLSAPVQTALNITQGLITLGADDFVDFLLSYFVELALLMLERIYIDPGLEMFLEAAGEALEHFIEQVKTWLPKYLQKKKKKGVEEVDFRKREVDVGGGGDEAETVEPILDSFNGVCQDTMAIYYTPFLTYLLMIFRFEILLPEIYGILEKDMLYYLYFSIVIIGFQVITDVFLHSVLELFHGWKIYEYLVYTRYRFLQRETRWKGMEDSLDECIDESMRTLDQMCFSSQYYLMLTIQVNGIMYCVLGMEMMLRAEYNPFSDTALLFIFLYMTACSVFLERFIIWFVLKIKLWKIKHENTAWHLQLEEEDDIDVPGWEDVKGASHDAYLMNQRITSETFRYKFLNYNRAWLIQQLPQLLTPRTLRRSRPYLINQFARIINSRRDDISEDSEDDRDKKKFGPVALVASSRNIIRWWLDKARRRLRLRHIVDPLIRRARGTECEQCLSRKQLQVEYEVDIDQMIKMYENMNPDDTEIDQVQWKTFWMRNQHYHTICLACVTNRKEKKRNEGLGSVPGVYEDDDRQEEYPDWGPVFLSAASKAILLNWYRKAQRLRAAKKGRKREKKAKSISDDEGEDVAPEWTKKMSPLTPASKAIAIKWARTARARLQKKYGKGANYPTAAPEAAPAAETFKAGSKSKQRKK